MDIPGQAAERPVVVERTATGSGELVLRRAGRHFEIISNGVFLMDTRGGESERLLVRAPLDRCAAPADVLIGGLGVGFSLAEAVAHPRLRSVDVVECEAAVIGWHAGHLAPFSAGAAGDPRVRLVNADLIAWLGGDGDGRPPPRDAYDVVCLDIDNGPDWTVTAANAELYGPRGLELVGRRLRPGGLLAVWSAAEAPAFEARLRARFAAVRVHRVPVRRGEPDVVYLASAGAS